MQHSTVQREASFVLAPGVTVETGYLQDSTGRRYPVDATGELVARHCIELVAADHLYVALQLLSGASADDVVAGTEQFVLQLHSRGLLSIHQSFVGEMWRALVLWPWDAVIMIIFRRMPVRRFSSRRIYRPTVPSVARAVFESYVLLPWVAVAGILTAVIFAEVVQHLKPAAPGRSCGRCRSGHRRCYRSCAWGRLRPRACTSDVSSNRRRARDRGAGTSRHRICSPSTTPDKGTAWGACSGSRCWRCRLFAGRLCASYHVPYRGAA